MLGFLKYCSLIVMDIKPGVEGVVAAAAAVGRGEVWAATAAAAVAGAAAAVAVAAAEAAAPGAPSARCFYPCPRCLHMDKHH